MSPRLVCIADTLGLHEEYPMEIPDGDILVHAGDVSMSGSNSQIGKFNAWFSALPHPHKVVIAGNHDWLFERNPKGARGLLDRLIIYFEDSGAEVMGLRFWGSPWSPWFFDWAFNLHRGEPMREKWRLVPEGTDVLVTHGPPLGAGDLVRGGKPEGCADLKEEMLGRIRPRLHVYGHIHEGYGSYDLGGIQCVNASLATVDYRPDNPAIVVDLE